MAVPLISGTAYRPAWPFRNAHVSTIVPSTLRRVAPVPYARKRLELPDGDFLDVDWCRADDRRAAVICHGLEGSARRPYVCGMARAFVNAGWDVAAMNYRGCSGEPNRLPRSYHSGATPDLRQVVAAVRAEGYETIVLVGFSLGGNLVLKYLGEDPAAVAPEVRAAVTVSVPVDLADTARALVQPGNGIYHARFLRKLRNNVQAKARALPGSLDPAPLARVRTIIDFDEYFTAPLHGFAGAADYYARNSSRQWLGQISVPSLLLTATNDPILGAQCYPRDEAAASRSLYLEETRWGGHVGFRLPGACYYSEQRAVAFVEEICRG
jgi:predicted alpha/beta-fold hydrolase